MSDMIQQRLDRTIWAAGLAIAFERIWAALLWPLVIASLALAFVLSGLMPWIPPLLRLGAMGVIAALFLWSLKPLFHLVWPTRHLAMRRVERASGLDHRPVSGFDDELAGGGSDPRQEVIWKEHKLRQLRQLDHPKAGAPRSAWRHLDGRALRLPAFLVLLASLVLGEGQPGVNLADSLNFATPAPAAALALDAWVKPPTYTGKAPVMLTSPAMIEKIKAGGEILVPENSVLTLRLSGGATPALAFHELSPDAAEIKGLKPAIKTGKDLFQADTKLTRPALVTLSDGGREIATWRIKLIPDRPPTIAFTADPSGDDSGTLTTKWKASDDYGVTGITADISLADNQDDGIGFSGNGIFLYEPPKFPVTLRKSSPKQEEQNNSADLAEHPWAGFMVEMTLTATDAAGHKTESETRTFRMPERLFIKPLAKVLIEQRKHLILNPDEQGQAEQMLEALIAFPDGLIESSGPYVAISAIISRLRATASQDDVDEAVNMLWQTAVGIEDGNMANAKAELEAIRRELEKALAEGAPPERIAELMDKLRGAMDRYLQSMMDEQRKQMGEGRLGDNQQRPERTVTPEELQKMLDTIQKLAESGANDAAKEMLSQLDDILRNLKPGTPGQARQGDQPMTKMLDELSDLMRKQQKLMDDTQRMQQPGEGEPSDQNGTNQDNLDMRRLPGDLAGDQKDIEGQLQELMRELGQNGIDPPPSLGGAGKSMKEAEGSLRRLDREGSLIQQGDAMSKLREGAQGIAKEMVQQGQGQQGSQGRHGEARGDDRDPLGRPMPSHGQDTGPNHDMVPSELAIRRAREILDMLRSKANEPALPALDRAYIERLLRGLY